MPRGRNEPVVSCRRCHAVLGSGARSIARCRYCGLDDPLLHPEPIVARPIARQLVPVASVARGLEKRAEVDGLMTSLMERYAHLMGSGRKAEALWVYEAFQFVVLSLAYEVEELTELAELARPFVEQVAKQLGAPYQPTVVTFAEAHRRAASGNE